jgi:NADH-quinone oxidoreductase subunit L
VLNLLWLVPILPLAGFCLLALGGRRIPHAAVSVIGVGTVGLSALLTAAIGAQFLIAPPAGAVFARTLWGWISVGGLNLGIDLRLDSLSLTMMFVVTFVGFLIHLYSAEHMESDEGYNRFFACLNLFVAMMLFLVLADNLILLYLGWEGVGLSSYLLIGFWYRDPANGRAARKAFLVTRVGDTSFAIGLLLLFVSLGTLQIQPLMQAAGANWPAGSLLPVAAAALLLGGAVGKSAQLPLQTWLPDAMAGPTPVSALIHAATMVTAGVYLIARTHVLFALAPAVMLAVAVIGAVTLLLAGFSALVQRDIKRVLAYSTMSQIGYMFLALGAGAWSAAIFHFWTHAFFKALLFLASGVLITAMEEDHDIFHMGGLRAREPLAFWTFLAGGASLAALPLVTAGFYSKDAILFDVWSSPAGGPVLWAAGLAGAFLTGLYTFRVIFRAFFGAPSHKVRELEPLVQPRARIAIPLAVLAALSLAAGFVNLPGAPLLSNFLSTALPAAALIAQPAGTETLLSVVASAVALLAVALAWWFFLRRTAIPDRAAASPAGAALSRWWFGGWGFDWLYERAFIRPYIFLARIDRNDVFDWLAENLVARPYRAIARFDRNDFLDAFFTGVARANAAANRVLSATQNGSIRWYVAGAAAGGIILLATAVLR